MYKYAATMRLQDNMWFMNFIWIRKSLDSLHLYNMMNFTFKHLELLAGTKKNDLLRKHIVRWKKDDLGIYRHKEKENKLKYLIFQQND